MIFLIKLDYSGREGLRGKDTGWPLVDVCFDLHEALIYIVCEIITTTSLVNIELSHRRNKKKKNFSL